MHHILEFLNQWDTWLFLKINHDWTGAFGDAVLPLARSKNIWMPLYFFLLLLVIYNFGWKSWTWLLFAVLTVVVSDQVSSSLVKYLFNRTRPCNLPALQAYIRVLVFYRPQSPSFTSSHATNHFAMAAYFYLTLKPYIHKWAYLFIFWAALICYAQVYVGVHYPGDVLGGALVGWFLGWITSNIFNKKIGMPALRSFQTVI